MLLLVLVFSWVGVLLYSNLLFFPELSVREAAVSPFVVFCRFKSKIQDGLRVPAFPLLCAPPHRARRITRVPCSFPMPCDSDRERAAPLSLLVLPHNSLLTAEIVLTTLESILPSALSKQEVVSCWCKGDSLDGSTPLRNYSRTLLTSGSSKSPQPPASEGSTIYPYCRCPRILQMILSRLQWLLSASSASSPRGRKGLRGGLGLSLWTLHSCGCRFSWLPHSSPSLALSPGKCGAGMRGR